MKIRPPVPTIDIAWLVVRRRWVTLVLAFIALAGCSPTPSPAASATTGTTTPSAAAQASSPSPEASVGPSTSVGPSPSGSPHLTYVALGDSLLYALYGDCGGCTSAAVLFGRSAEQTLGIPVEVHNLTMHNGLTSDGLLGYLTNGATIGQDPEDVLKAVAGADIVSVSIGFNDPSLSDKDDLAAMSKRLETNLDGILGRIVELRAGRPTAIRVIDIYNNGIAATPEADPDGPGTGLHGWKQIVEAQNAVICRVAKKHGAACVDIYHPYNGTDGTASPEVKGYLGPDGTHPSQLGQQVIADALTGAGYAPLR